MTSFNATTWLNQIVKTSEYQLSGNLDTVEGLDIDAQQLIEQLISIKKLDVDQQSRGALLPPRLPKDCPVPAVLSTHFEEIVNSLLPYGTDLHPAVKHALLAVALTEPRREQKIDSLKPLFTGLDNGVVYQPTVTQLAFLRHDWFEPKHYVKPSVKGGADPNKLGQGVTTEIVLSSNNMRVNPKELFTWAKPIELVNAKIPAPASEWAETATQAWSLPNPPTTSLWMLAFADLKTWWAYLPPGAALWNPSIDNEVVEDLFHNSLQHKQLNFYTRMGTGIADIYPVEKDALLATYVEVNDLLNAKPSFNTMMSIYHHSVSDQLAFGIPSEWIDDLKTKTSLMDSLDLIPQYSIFHQGKSLELLDTYATTRDPQALQEFFKFAVSTQLTINSTTRDHLSDAFDLGFPMEADFRSAPTPEPSEMIEDLTHE